ncbi:MAG: DUF72 domain-containing protein [Elusimicrobiota bacterium]
MSVHVGCCGLPVSSRRYFSSLRTVELDAPFYSLPRIETARRWRREAPEGFEFSLKAWQLITHPSASPTYRRLGAGARKGYRLERCGFFRDTEEVARAWEGVLDTARALAARFILFQTPSSFRPGPDRLRDFYRFFKNARRERFRFAWEPRGDWQPSLAARVCSDLGLVRAFDPLALPQARALPAAGGGPLYLRLYRNDFSGPYTDAELGRLRESLRGKETVFAYFGGRTMWNDSRRFARLLEGAARRGGL